MYSVKVAKQCEASQGWEWQPEEVASGQGRAAKTVPSAALPRAAVFGSAVTGIAVLATTLLAAAGFVWPADAARQSETQTFLSSAAEVLAWDGARKSHTSPQAVLIELAQQEGTGGAMVPPVKRQPPQTPATQPEPVPPPASAKPEAAPAPAAPAAPIGQDSTASGSWFDAIGARISDWLSNANRAYQGTIVKELSKPSPEDAEAARLAADRAKQEQAAREQAERVAAEKARAAAAEAEAQAQARKRAEAEAQLKAQEAAKAEEARKQAEAAAQQRATQAQKPAEPVPPDKKAAEQEEAEKLRAAEEQRVQRYKEEQERHKQAEAERKAREGKAEEERKAKVQAEAEAKKAAEAARVPREAVATAVREQPEPVLRHRKWAVTIIPEPIGRRGARSRDDADGIMVRGRKLDGRMGLGVGSVRSGTAVKRWVMRDTSCRFAGREYKRRYVVARGDSLWRISEKYYRVGAKYPRIYWANRDRIADPDLIYPCQRFRVPKR